MFQTVSTLLNKNIRRLPTGFSTQILCNKSVTFFREKVAKIRHSLDVRSGHNLISSVNVAHSLCSSSLCEFHQITQDDVCKIITGSPSKTCKLDCIPTWILKEHLSVFLPFVTHVINTSLTTGVFPESLGRAVITPIIKKPSLDCNEFSNYRPVSNINFISKILEKVVAGQLKHYLTENKLIETYQSAYVPNKSTETALLKVQSDILNAVDSREVVFLVMLDLSAAFDTIDHGILLHCLQNNFGISGNVLKWIRSYLESKTYQVQIDGIFSDTYDLEYGVPQGSVLGPLGFILYTSPVGNIIRKHGLKFHVYADDTQIYVSFNPRSPGACRAALRQLEHCITDLSDWMSTNMLKLNPTKTEFFIAGTSQGLQKTSIICCS